MSLVTVSLDTFLYSADTSCDLLGSSAIPLTFQRNLLCHQPLISALNPLADHVPVVHPRWKWLYLHWLVVWAPPVTIPPSNPFLSSLPWHNSSQHSTGAAYNSWCGCLRWTGDKFGSSGLKCLDTSGVSPWLCRTPRCVTSTRGTAAGKRWTASHGMCSKTDPLEFRHREMPEEDKQENNQYIKLLPSQNPNLSGHLEKFSSLGIFTILPSCSMATKIRTE